MGICKPVSMSMDLQALGGSRVYGDLQALVGSDGPRLVGAVSMGICKLWSAVLGLVWWEPCLCGFASFGRQFWASFAGSRVCGDLQLWSAVMGLVWWEPCLWGFAALVNDGPRLVGAVSMGIFKLWLAVMGLVWWEPCLWGFASFGRQFWASFGGSRVYGKKQLWSAICKLLSALLGLVWWEPCLWGFAALVGSSGPRLVGAVSLQICKLWSAVLGLGWWEPCLQLCWQRWASFVASFGRQFWASFGGVYGDLQALVGSDGPRLVGAVSMGIWSAVMGLVWWEPCL